MQHACEYVPCRFLLKLISVNVCYLYLFKALHKWIPGLFAANSDEIISSLMKMYLFGAEAWKQNVSIQCRGMDAFKINKIRSFSYSFFTQRVDKVYHYFQRKLEWVLFQGWTTDYYPCNAFFQCILLCNQQRHTGLIFHYLSNQCPRIVYFLQALWQTSWFCLAVGNHKILS